MSQNKHKAGKSQLMASYSLQIHRPRLNYQLKALYLSHSTKSLFPPSNMKDPKRRSNHTFLSLPRNVEPNHYHHNTVTYNLLSSTDTNDSG